MAIETLNEWNNYLSCSGCCLMPECPTPEVVCESAVAGNCGHILPNHPSNLPYDNCRRFRVRTSIRTVTDVVNDPPILTRNAYDEYTYIEYADQDPLSNGFNCTYSNAGSAYGYANVTERQGLGVGQDPNTFVTVFDRQATLNPCVITGTHTTTRTYDDGTPPPETIITPSSEIFPTYCFFITRLEIQNDWIRTEVGGEVTYSKTTVNGSITTVRSVTFSEEHLIGDILNEAEYEGSDCDSVRGCAFARKVKARFKIPVTHEGSYFKITYDVAEFPSSGLIEPFFVSEDNVVEWSGVGNFEDENDESWLTPQFDIDLPDNYGERRIVNIRYSCYHGTLYGVKPQTTGEAFTPAPP